MKSRRQLTKIFYKDESFVGYISIEDNNRYLEFLIENTKYEDELLSSEVTNIEFHCPLHSGRTLSLFKCNFLHSKNEYLVRYSIGVLVEGYVESYSKLTMVSSTVTYPNVNSWLMGEAKEEYSYKIAVGNTLGEIKIAVGESIKEDNYKRITSSYLMVSIKCRESVHLKEMEEIYFKINTLFSFLTNCNIGYNNFNIQGSERFPMNLSRAEEFSENLINLKKVNYVPKDVNKNTIKKLLIDPLASPIFDVWLHYVSILKSNPMLEEKFLSYARCLEIISRHYGENVIYEEKVRKEKSKQYKEMLKDLDISEEYKDNLKEAFKHSNKKNLKFHLVELINKYHFSKTISSLSKNDSLKDVAKNIVNLRNHLTHGGEFTEINIQALLYYTQLTKLIAEHLILAEHNVENYNFEIPDFIKSFKSLPEPIIK